MISPALLWPVIAAGAVGMLIGWLVSAVRAGRERANLQAGNAALATQVKGLQQRLAEKEDERKTLADELRSTSLQLDVVRQENAGLNTAIEKELKSAAEKLAVLERAEDRLRDTFRALSADALRSSSTQFLELAATKLKDFQRGAQIDLEARQTAIGELMRPLNASLVKMDGTLKEIDTKRVGTEAGLKQLISGVQDTQERLKSETANLVRALRNPSVRGRWGEMQLKRVVELAGMVNFCDFSEQVSVTTEEGRMRPDLVVKLPNSKCVVVDAKAPLEAYLKATEAADDDSRDQLLAQHASQVRDHIAKLAAKAYWDQFDATPEFVVLFLPGESFFSSALQADPTLIEFGVDRRVITATPTTLISLLKAVAYGWQQESIAKNAQEISDLGRQLYERIGTLAEHFSALGKYLTKSVDSYNRAIGTLESRVMVSARHLKECGAMGSDDIESPSPIDVSAREPIRFDFAADSSRPPGAAAELPPLGGVESPQHS